MTSRRHFIRTSSLGALGLALNQQSLADEPDYKFKPIVLSTWRHGLAANQAAWNIINSGGTALDAVEAGVSVTESDLTNMSVGLGGRPDRDGFVTLDACIMDHLSRCGSVAFLQHIEHPIQVARKVMDQTPHVMLVGEGAYQFALESGFKRFVGEVPTAKAKAAYDEWLKKGEYQPPANVENHDTIGMVALDSHGNLSGACTTSGLGYKMHGRVGDSPIIGAGLFVDNEVGAATATGVGEMVIRIAGAHTVVELMRHGASPQQACEEAIDRIIKKHPDVADKQVGFLAINRAGHTGAFGIRKGFQYAQQAETGVGLYDATSRL
ncbi:MAG: N(4)-(beta-N-acetylglucosaminyl)-L-asparaginase [Flavobacteriales bacterium]|nr:N(4)-(beta-N-acetylglucosaminyl)-L-asparaginase [Bacteroidota bacterium]MCB9240131.1 N(4)-(beta-N-acetylglucosaminyl)-L-asparaginase [Flavobacteriales bacterium]